MYIYICVCIHVCIINYKYIYVYVSIFCNFSRNHLVRNKGVSFFYFVFNVQF